MKKDLPVISLLNLQLFYFLSSPEHVHIGDNLPIFDYIFDIAGDPLDIDKLVNYHKYQGKLGTPMYSANH